MCVYAYVYTPVRAYKINTKNISMNSVHMYICICMYVSMYVMYVCVYYIYICVCMYLHIHVYRQRDRERVTYRCFRRARCSIPLHIALVTHETQVAYTTCTPQDTIVRNISYM